MESKAISKERPIYKVNLFYFLTLIWAIMVQFLPFNENLYQYIAFLIPIIIYLVINRKSAKKILKLNPLNKKSLLLIPVIWIFMLPLSMFVITIYTSYFGSTLAELVTEETSNTAFGILLFTALTPAVLEEILMRGIVLEGYSKKRRLIAAIINGLMFGMLHLNSFQFSHTFFAGIVASYLVYSTNSIFSSMLIHFINNGFPLFMDLIMPTSDAGPEAIGETNLLLLGIAVVICLFIVYLLMHKLAEVNNISLKEEREELSDEKIFNWPLIISIFIFLLFSLLLSFSLKTM
ncbi:CPBP family intramembrane glutamic endopeptidase [Anaerosalibacter sp. Marseille-P3206]|uniref:CPBP family intramembrane glutamic endopeptidase n=1 Tax=Anaerosalibacter sp. Marseille-P3206 TaxID=1871005 RepID=UPI0009875256|nr:type II CAAX endopeptidase family protein [Anaerosalibacter sp. Marseille-P3206]